MNPQLRPNAPQPSGTSTSTPRRKPPREIDYSDVDDIIGIAAELSDLERERLSVEDLESVARELDIPAHHVGPAITELKRRRAAMLLAEEKRQKRRLVIIASAVGLVATLVVWGLIAQSGLGAMEADIAQKRAQVVSVLERQRATDRQWRDLPHSPERAAELSGAENRVRLERQRYDEAVAAYNARASGFPTSLFARIFGRPDRIPLSNELESF